MNIEKILGKYYKWWYIFQFSVKVRTSSYFDLLIFVFGQMFVVLTTMLIWWVANDKHIDTGFIDKIQYFVIGELIFSLLYQFESFFGFSILRGQHTKYLLYPSNFFGAIYFNYLGQAFLQNISKLGILTPMAIILTIIGWIDISSLNIFALVGIVLFSSGIFFFVEMLTAFSGFFVKQVNGIILNISFITLFLSGKSIPLNLLFDSFWINVCNPLAYIFYHPVSLFTGKYSIFESVIVIGCSIVWTLLLYILAKVVFNIGLKHNESVGL